MRQLRVPAGLKARRWPLRHQSVTVRCGICRIAATCSGVRTSVGVMRETLFVLRIKVKDPAYMYSGTHVPECVAFEILLKTVWTTRQTLCVRRIMYDVINAILKNELWAGRTANDIVKFLQAAGMAVDAMKVGAWKRDRVPSLDQLSQIEHAHGLPRGWILWRAGYIDAEALVARGSTPPAAIVIDTPTPAELVKQLAEMRADIAKLMKQRR